MNRILDREHIIEDQEFLSREEITVGPLTARAEPGSLMAIKTSDSKYYPHAPAAADGTQNAKGILLDGLDISTADQKGVINNRHTVANGKKITFASGITGPQKTAAIAALADLGVLIRQA